MFKTYKVNPMQKAFLPSLQEWVDGHELNHEWINGSRVRDRTHFSVTIRKVNLLDEYSERDKEDLEWITQEYYKWKKNL
jgi:hypothetical protein